MFLDDEMFEYCENMNITTFENLQKDYALICIKFDDYRKNAITNKMNRKEMKAVVNRTFNLWDSLVNRLLISRVSKLKSIGGLLQRNSYKDSFLKDKKMKAIYDSL